MAISRRRWEQRKGGGEMAGEHAAAIVALVEEQAGRVAFDEAKLEVQPVLPNHEPLRRCLAQDQLR